MPGVRRLSIPELAERVLQGEPAAASRALSIVIDERPGFEELAKRLFGHTGRAHVIGLAGPPGSGKSSLVGALLSHYRAKGERLGVLAVDPTSPFTGGAFLGDRLRVQHLATDPGIFFRSVATRGAMGGVSATVFAAIHVLDAFGCDRVFVETVGIGQDETEIAKVADTTALVTAPSLGDEIQAMKAGTMEIADVFVVNKADLQGADKAVSDLRAALSLIESSSPRLIPGGAPGATQREAGRGGASAWDAPIVATSTVKREGVEELAEALERHREHLRASAEGERRKREQLKEELALFLAQRLYDDTMRRVTAEHLDALQKRAVDPVTLAGELLAARAR